MPVPIIVGAARAVGGGARVVVRAGATAARGTSRLAGKASRAVDKLDAAKSKMKQSYQKGLVKAEFRTELQTEAFLKFFSEGLQLALDKIGTDIAEDIKETIQTRAPKEKSKKTGKATKSRTASKAPKPPHYRQGSLFRSIKHAVVYQAGATTDNIVLRIGSDNVIYSGPLELGSKKNNLPKRPYIAPVVNRWLNSGKVTSELKLFYKEWMSQVPAALK